jgi:hypothetical protein
MLSLSDFKAKYKKYYQSYAQGMANSNAASGVPKPETSGYMNFFQTLNMDAIGRDSGWVVYRDVDTMGEFYSRVRDLSNFRDEMEINSARSSFNRTQKENKLFGLVNKEMTLFFVAAAALGLFILWGK